MFKGTKRWISALLAIFMLVSLMAVIVLPAAAATNEYGETVSSTGLVDKSGLPDIKDGVTSGVTEYKVSDRAGLEKIAEIVNGGKNNYLSGVTIYQTQDIDMAEDGLKSFTPIGTNTGTSSSGVKFKGVYDGNGFVIYNLYICAPTTEPVALFGSAYGTIKNLGIASGLIIGKDRVGSIVGQGDGAKLYNCWNAATVVGVAGGNGVGGIAGRAAYGGKIYNCYNLGMVISTNGGKPAGIQAWVGGSSTTAETGAMRNCYSLGEILAGLYYVSSNAGEAPGAQALVRASKSNNYASQYNANTGNNYYSKEYLGYKAGSGGSYSNVSGSKVDDGGTALDAEAFTGSEAADKLNAGIEEGQPYSVEGYTLQFDPTGEYPAISYYKEGVLTVQRRARQTLNLMGSEHEGSELLETLRSLAYSTDANWTAADEVRIATADDLYLLSLLTIQGSTYKNNAVNITVTKNIDMDEVTISKEPMLPLYYAYGAANYYTGTLDGGNHIIENLNIYGEIRGNEVYGVGLVGCMQQGLIQNLGIASGTVTGYLTNDNKNDTASVGSFTGALTGNSSYSVETGSKLYHCWSAATVVATKADGLDSSTYICAGGLVGRALHSATIDSCFFAGKVKSVDTYVGGFTAWNQSNSGTSFYPANIYNSFDISDTTQTTRTGTGIVGNVTDYIYNSYSLGHKFSNNTTVDSELKQANFGQLDENSPGELAWRLNSSAYKGNFSKAYYTTDFDQAETLFGDETTQTRKVDIIILQPGTGEEPAGDPQSEYYNAGSPAKVTYDISQYTFERATADVSDANGTITFTMPTEDVTVYLRAKSVSLDRYNENKDIYAKYDPAYFTDPAAVKAVQDALNAVAEELEQHGEKNQGTLRTLMTALTAALDAAEPLTLVAEYPNIPRVTEYDTYVDLNTGKIWGIKDEADWRAAVALSQNATHPILSSKLHLLDNIVMSDEPVQPFGYNNSTNFTGLLDGHDKVFKNLLIAVNIGSNSANFSTGLISYVAGSGTIQNLGIESGEIKVTTSGEKSSVGVGTIAGIGSNARFYKCWSAANVTVTGNSGDWSVSAFVGRGMAKSVFNGCYATGTVVTGGSHNSGLNDWAQGSYVSGGSTDHATHFNSFFAGTLTEGNAGVIRYNNPFRDRKENNFTLNVWGVGYDVYRANSTFPDSFNETYDPDNIYKDYNTSHKTTANAYASGELAWNLNNDYRVVSGHDQIYYTVKDGKTVFGADDGSDQTWRITLNYPNNRKEYLYVNNGEGTELPVGATYTLAAGSESYAELNDRQLSNVTNDMAVDVTPDKIDTTLVDQWLAYFEERDTSVYAEGLDALIEEVKAWLLDEENLSDEQVGIYAAKLEKYSTDWTKDVKKLPKVAERESLYPDAPNYTIRDTDDLVYVQENAKNFKTTDILYVANDIHIEGTEFTGIANGSGSNTNAGLSASIDGLGHTIYGNPDMKNGTGFIYHFSGNYIKDLTLEDYHVAGSSYRAIFITYGYASSLTLENITLRNCTLNKTADNGAGGLISSYYANGHIDILGCTVENCTMTGTTSSNSAFVFSRLYNINSNSNATATIKDVTVIGNKMEFTSNANGRGIIMGVIEGNVNGNGTQGTQVTMTNVAAFDNKIATTNGTNTGKGVLVGLVQDQETYFTTENVIAAGNTGGSAELVLFETGTETEKANRTPNLDEISMSNVWFDGVSAEKGVTQIATEDAKSGAAAYEANQVVEQKWYMPAGKTWPEWRLNGEALPVKVTFSLTKEGAENLPEETYKVYYTDETGKAIGDGLDDLIAEGENAWAPEVPANKTFTEDKDYIANLVQTDTNLKLNAASLTLYNDLAVSFKINKEWVDKFAGDEVYMVFKLANGEPVLVRDSKATTDNNTDRLSFEFRGIDPDQIADIIYITVYGKKNGELYRSNRIYTYSVAEYCENMLSKETSGEAFKTLLADLLGYGQEAYKFTHDGASDLTISGLLETYGDHATKVDPELQDDRKELDNAGVVTWDGVGLNLSDSAAVRVTITVTDGNTEGLVLQGKSKTGVGDNTTKITEFTPTGDPDHPNQYTAVLPGLAATQLRELVELSIWRDGEQVSSTYQFSVESYAAVMENDGKVGDLVKALMKYGDAAVAYAASKKK